MVLRLPAGSAAGSAAVCAFVRLPDVDAVRLIHLTRFDWYVDKIWAI